MHVNGEVFSGGRAANSADLDDDVGTGGKEPVGGCDGLILGAKFDFTLSTLLCADGGSGLLVGTKDDEEEFVLNDSGAEAPNTGLLY